MLTKRVSASWPSTVGVVEPGSVAETWPCGLIEIDCALVGMVMPGCTTLPCDGDDAALRVHLERAVAGVGEGAVRHRHLEEAFAADGDVEIGAGRRQRALRHQARRADGLDAAAEIDADRQDVALRRGLGADAAHVLVEQILEFGALALVAGRAHVGDVVGDDLDVELLGHHSGRRGVKCAHDCVSY